MAKQKNRITGAAAGVGMAIAATAVAALAGSYFLYGKDAKKNRKKVNGWMLRAKGEVLEKLERAKDMNEEVYQRIVDSVGQKYAAVKSVDPDEIKAMVADLKSHWKNISRQLARAKKSPKKRK